MKTVPSRLMLTAAVLLVAQASAPAAQEMPALPDICTAGADHHMGAAGDMTHGTVAPNPVQETLPSPAHEALMQGMDDMNTMMMQGMSASDVDVAFVCGMIPHHRGAIAMAEAELVHGDDAWAREMAQKIIDSQEREIAEMLAWLEKRDQADE